VISHFIDFLHVHGFLPNFDWSIVARGQVIVSTFFKREIEGESPSDISFDRFFVCTWLPTKFWLINHSVWASHRFNCCSSRITSSGRGSTQTIGQLWQVHHQHQRQTNQVADLGQSSSVRPHVLCNTSYLSMLLLFTLAAT
jgi:hypothetical protein